MDERSWATPVPLVLLCWLGALGTATWAVFTNDAPGRVLAGAAAIAFAGYAGYSMIIRPRLAADRNGLAVRGLGGRRDWTWQEITVDVVTTRRLGRDVATLEIHNDRRAGDSLDGDEQDGMVILGWLDLGQDPRDVADDLCQLRDRE